MENSNEVQNTTNVGNEILADVSNGIEIIEKFVSSWRNTDKHPCPKCGAKLGMPDYKCEKCNVKLKLKMRF